MSIQHLQPVPHLTTVQNGPLLLIEQHLLDRHLFDISAP